ncbi:iron dependent repressor, metal binding and dimerization domain protein [Lactococcus taiwanensis]|uniref:metal-dependent transcriptional regulator n=1 Tax=Lactococcus taiwanensis TaxID=1151742 RepID=UPI0023F11F34|nr:iron dependent repressor, metal binding and dimerization domain protein [Lactococcus taiwanensis]
MLELSKNEQDYLKTIYNLEKITSTTTKSVSINAIAKKLSVSSPSATEMVKRLVAKNLVLHKPYYGVSLTDLGISQARFIIKSHRVWETFLFEEVGYSMDEVHHEAEDLEHASSPRLIEALYALMDYPVADPHGSEIPAELFWSENETELSLDQAMVNKNYRVTKIDTEAKTFFKKMELTLPQFFKVIERLEDKSLIVREKAGKMLLIPFYIQPKLWVSERK